MITINHKINGGCNPRYYYLYMVGRIGFEPMTSSVSGKHSPTELTTHLTLLIIP